MAKGGAGGGDGVPPPGGMGGGVPPPGGGGGPPPGGTGGGPGFSGSGSTGGLGAAAAGPMGISLYIPPTSHVTYNGEASPASFLNKYGALAKQYNWTEPNLRTKSGQFLGTFGESRLFLVEIIFRQGNTRPRCLR
jgi:hypothetical protein